MKDGAMQQTTISAEYSAHAERPANVAHPSTTRAIELIGAGGLAVVVGVHLLDLSSKFAEVPYLGVAYVALIAGAVAAIGLLLRRDRRG